MAVSIIFGALPSISEEATWENDILQAIMVLLCVYAGWFVWSFVLRVMAIDVNITVKPLHKKVVEADSNDNAPVNMSSRAAGLALLEQYGVFGLEPGTWEA